MQNGVKTDIKLTDVMRTLLIPNSKISKKMKGFLSNILPSIPPAFFSNKKAVSLQEAIFRGGSLRKFKPHPACTIQQESLLARSRKQSVKWERL